MVSCPPHDKIFLGYRDKVPSSWPFLPHIGQDNVKLPGRGNRVAHNLQKVKNSTSGGNRPVADYQADLAEALDNFEREAGVHLDPFVYRTLGASGHAPNSRRDRPYRHPFPFITTYGSYIFGCVSVPADIDDGESDFTNLYLIANSSHLVVVFNDPHWVYNPFFGGAVLNLLSGYERQGSVDVPAVIVQIVKFALAALDHALEALANRYSHYEKAIAQIDSFSTKQLEKEIPRLTRILENVQIETSSLGSVLAGTAEILEEISGRQLLVQNGQPDLFSHQEKLTCNGLRLHAANLKSFHSSLLFDIDALLRLLDRHQERFLTLATHRITALGALILFPNLIFDFFGQAFDPLPQWLRTFGFQFTLLLTLSYWVLHFIWFKRRKYL